ncbi:YchJ family metal-binding protein [Pararobbsia silviterrae]|uniref:YchJ-like middle NTF2-like domain-containing protein n=1 Tax=Pararobbsia silviterrae TaxID=1792498 RepID=A0A494Y7X4_9BURK|nr:YchJ family metal-binding protein [Pararobbsia silviterrae]RKP58744.1 hypothetical protein D7S86_02080 [Pararobbsia silviterrae]
MNTTRPSNLSGGGKRAPLAPCPCGGRALDAKSKPAASYDTCCARFIEEGQLPATAEQLMRSRYTAYVLERYDYLRATWDPSTCPADLGAEPGPQWLGLDVKLHVQSDATHAIVEFVARYKTGGRGHRLHEISRFTRADDGRWRYVDGNVSES